MTDESSEAARQRSTYMLTTYDNPFDPFDQWDEWLAWDMRAGYNTPGLLARIALTSEDLSPIDEHRAIQNAIDEIVRENISGMHRKLRRGEFKEILAEREREAAAEEQQGQPSS